MNKNLKKVLAPVILAGVLALPTFAQASQITAVNDRQAKQGSRINAGERSGELTSSEVSQLRTQAARIRQNEDNARRSGGNFTEAEKRSIQDQLDALSRDIDQLRYNNQRARGAYVPAGVNNRQNNNRQNNNRQDNNRQDDGRQRNNRQNNNRQNRR